MSTGNKFANITQQKLLGYRDLYDRFLQYLQGIVRESHEKVWDEPAVHDTPLTLEADGSGAIKVTGTSTSADGQGRLLKISDALVNDGITFENSIGIDYYVALKYTDIPEEIDINPRTGTPEYRNWKEEIGEKSVPDSVTDNGNGTITFQVDGVTEAGVNNSGRQVMVYKLIAAQDATTFAVAVETCTVAWTGTNNEITTSAALGQSTVSTTASDYNVVLLGPTIKRYVDLRSTDGYVFLGIVTGNAGTPTAFDMTDQQLASISLSQLAHVASKASNDRLKIDVTPLYSEVGINQITSRGTNGEELFTVDEKGTVSIPGIPRLDTNRNPLHPSIAVSSTTIQTSLSDAKSLAACTVDGKRKIFIIDKTSKVAELWDVESMTMDDSQDLTSIFNYSSLLPLSACGDGKYVYIWSNYSAITYINAVDVTDWSAKSGWPTHGISLGITSGGPNADYIGKMIENLDSSRLISARWLAGQQLVIISKDDGSILSTGDGDAPGTNYEPRAICFDGKYIYSLHIEGGTGVSYVISASIDNLSVGNGVSGWPKTISTGSNSYPGWIATVDDYVIAPGLGVSTSFWAFNKCGKTDFAFQSGYPESIKVACSDGVHMWVSGDYVKYGYGDDEKYALFRLNHNSLIDDSSGTSVRTIDVYSRYFEPFVIDSNVTFNGFSYGNLMLFDGNDLFCAYKHSTYFVINRIPNVLFKNTSPPELPIQTNILNTISGGAVNIDCRFLNHTILVNQDITSFTISNYSRPQIITVILKSTGGYDVSGFEISSYRRWPASPRPTFNLLNGYHYVLKLNSDGAYVYFDWSGPYTSL